MSMRTIRALLMDVVLALLLTLLLHQPLSGQSPGQVTPINLIGGNATLDPE